MNIKNLDKLIAALEAAPDEKFNMEFLYSDAAGREIWPHTKDIFKCDTAACIAGWCGLLAKKKNFHVDEAQKWLDIDEKEAEMLCIPFVYSEQPAHSYTKRRAVATLKLLRKTGKVDWGRVPKVAS